ncbi:sugar transporter ERD6-like 8 [Apium graveolens]|uniref:sugar transporter ERD6-like 8 n=1 Tax=Apium graveolens TaxID=4045 RepID=UPI003D78F301
MIKMGALSLDIGRFLTGYSIGIVSYVAPVYIAEKFNRTLSDEVARVKKVQGNMSLVLHKLLEANSGLNIDMAQICGTISGDKGVDGTPLTGGRST